ncbi:response regulator [Dermatophilus congolensis]|uniref:Transcriptional regulatory protein devR (DosR) n=1 Tax=Dermatophilus congolensis TaxID=1863 RepID=A0A239VMN7_9MICO|nr:response regulator transcription factor [Dermatophilus congolensis]MBO3129549.1 response regulator transcription factor [Dermatophilus congolensis]MBO3131818.1 response regulator transcription factor [Dermatophilus congolensis]MBO3134025.1 response regulator transcription factor [Dermatophilus congolensis]MBO3136257.1 response regulator transcription factor [Dermatophilus congolensis]MBO3138504.1 response regulator transcription factor [Dermatophilus congolensis]
MTTLQAASPARPIRVFLLDDHEIMRRGLRDLLELEPDITVVGEASSVAEAVQHIPFTHPDVAILDMRLPDGSGVDVCQAVRAHDEKIRSLILTSFNDEEALTAALRAGACGYAIKDVRGEKLLADVRALAAGQTRLDARRPTSAAQRSAGRCSDVSDPRLRSLTAQERRILARVAQGMTNRQIGEDLFLAEKTVKNYITAILAKLGMKRRTQAAVFAATHSDDLFN